MTVALGSLAGCGSPDERAPGCLFETAITGGGTQDVTEHSPVSCGAGYGPGIVEMGFTVHAASLVRRFTFSLPDLPASTVGTTIPAHVRLVPPGTDYDAPGWFAQDCSISVDRIQDRQNTGAATTAHITAHGTCNDPAEPEPGNSTTALLVAPFRFTGIAGWNN